ncbi:MAG: tetratricopeptide repeat protein [Planctomycetota bacterium]|nr:tetratricopeptide repeat protein [Planctomycetota bacterium]
MALIICGVWLFCGGVARFAVSKAKSALALRELDVAQEWLNFADRFNGDQAEIAFQKARASRIQGDIGKAKKWLGIAHKLGTDRRTLWREWILVFAQVGQMHDVESRLDELLHNPGDDSRDIFEAFVNGFVLNSEFDKAHALATLWITDFPDDAHPWLARALIRQQTQRTHLAEEDYREGLKRDPNSLDGLKGLGNVLLAHNRPTEAMVQFRRSLEIHPGEQASLVGFAKTLTVLGRPEEALLELNRVLSADPIYDRALLYRGKLHFAAGRYTAAVEDFDFLCRLRTGGVEPRYQLAIAMRASGREKEAVEHFEFVEKGRAELRRAIDLISQDSPNQEAATEAGCIFLKYGEAMQGLPLLTSVLSTDPDNRRILEVLATYYRECSEIDKRLVRSAEHYQARLHSLTAERKALAAERKQPSLPVAE